MRDWTLIAAAPLLVASVAGCDMLGSGNKTEITQTNAAGTKIASAASRLCGANATYARLKESAFDEAKRIRERDTEALDALADASVVRMENPLLENRDEALGLTVCSGRMILELPPGAGAAFDGRQRLSADVTYSAQTAADGSGTVFKIDGGEPIVYRLAAFDPTGGGTRTASVAEDAFEPSEPAVLPDAPIVVPARPVAPAAEPVVIPVLPSRSAERAAERTRAARAATVARAERETATARAAQATRAARVRETELRAARDARTERIAEARRDDRGEETRGSAAAARPSFNCRYARSRVERLICEDGDLAARDRRMAALYYRTNGSSDAVVRRRLSASRLRFLAYRDRCPNAACVAAAYEDRIDEINDIADE